MRRIVFRRVRFPTSWLGLACDDAAAIHQLHDWFLSAYHVDGRAASIRFLLTSPDADPRNIVTDQLVQ